MTLRHAVVIATLLGTVVMAGAGADFHEELAGIPDRAFVLMMQGTAFNGLTWPDTPLLEAFVGERVTFTVFVPPLAEAHTIHIHGHPWLVPSQNRVVDTFLLKPTDVHRFDVIAGGVGGQAGDWMYHCHMDFHVAGGMWGVFRVHPFSVHADPGASPGAFTVHTERLGEPVTDAAFTVTLDGAAVPARATHLGGGTYALDTGLAGDAHGVLAIAASSAALGDSRTRIALGDATVEPVRPTGAAADLVLAGLRH